MNTRLIREYETRAAGGSSAEPGSTAHEWLVTRESQQSEPLVLISAQPMSDLLGGQPKLAFTKSTPRPESREPRFFATPPRFVQQDAAPALVEAGEEDLTPIFASELYENYMATDLRYIEGGIERREYDVTGSGVYRIYLDRHGAILRGTEVQYEQGQEA